MADIQADVLVCGAGIAGVACGFHLARSGARVVITDPLAPLSLTSDKSTECYRNWWPHPPMVELMNRSIDILDALDAESSGYFSLNRRGYLYATASGADSLESTARNVSSLGAGELRVHTNGGSYSRSVRHGADLIVGTDAVGSEFGWLTPETSAVLHVRRAGWLSAQQLGAYMIEDATRRGAALLRAKVVGVGTKAGRVAEVSLDNGQTVAVEAFVNAAGPMLAQVGLLTGVDVPVQSEVHHKIAFRDTLGTVPRDAPLTIWADPLAIPWSDDELTALYDMGREDLTGPLPPACHGRPEGAGDWVLALWEYQKRRAQPSDPIEPDPVYAEMVLRGMAVMIPAMTAYLDRMPQPTIDGGLYTKAADNLPLAGRLGPEGAFVCGALSGYGIMAAAAVSEIVATSVTGGSLPGYTRAFAPDRFDDPAYELPEADGQL